MTLDWLLTDKDLIPPLERMPMDSQPALNVREEIFAVANTADYLSVLGDENANEVEPEDEERARDIFDAAREPTTTEKKLPGTMVKLNALLDEYDHAIIDDAQQVRTYVTNRLLEESNDADPKIRMRALELLGKISDVGLFTERQEVTVRHQSTEELENKLRDKLTKLANEDVIEGEWSEQKSFDDEQPDMTGGAPPADPSPEDIFSDE